VNSRDVLDFWFEGDPDAFREERWFGTSDTFDAECRDRFGLTARAALDGALDAWTYSPEGSLALVLALDQFPRNIHRGSHLAFAGDAHARRVADGAVRGGADRFLTPVQRIFLYLPFEHSEDMQDQDHSVALFDALALEAPHLAECRKAAQRHRGAIRRFGRFPHRNAALGRTTTPEEAAWMDGPDSLFSRKKA
jgi:uncharacterized protein (DUF924 family)